MGGRLSYKWPNIVDCTKYANINGCFTSQMLIPCTANKGQQKQGKSLSYSQAFVVHFGFVSWSIDILEDFNPVGNYNT